LNLVTLRRSKERSNREYKAYLNERPYYVYSTKSIDRHCDSGRRGSFDVLGPGGWDAGKHWDWHPPWDWHPAWRPGLSAVCLLLLSLLLSVPLPSLRGSCTGVRAIDSGIRATGSDLRATGPCVLQPTGPCVHPTGPGNPALPDVSSSAPGTDSSAATAASRSADARPFASDPGDFLLIRRAVPVNERVARTLENARGRKAHWVLQARWAFTHSWKAMARSVTRLDAVGQLPHSAWNRPLIWLSSSIRAVRRT